MDGDKLIVRRIQAKFFLIDITSDILCPLFPMRYKRDKLLEAGVVRNYKEIESDYGQDSFLVEEDKYRNIISEFLELLYNKEMIR